MGPLPTFLVIGAQKSGTRWLSVNVGRHPDVFVADRELSHWVPPESAPIETYLEHFAEAGAALAIGEATPAYMMLRPTRLRSSVAEQIDQALPGVRLMAMLRNPVDRSISAFVHHQRRNRIDADADCFETLRTTSPGADPHGLIRGSLYGASLEPFVERFGDRVLALRQDDIAVDPVGLYRSALTHIGVDPNFVPDDLEAVRFSNRTDRSPALDDQQRAVIRERFVEDMEHLSRLVDVDVSIWSS